jgi:hypothetical protein
MMDDQRTVPPDELEERVVRSLRRRGLVVGPPSIRSRVIYAIAAAAVFAAGLFAGRAMGGDRQAAAPELPRFALLLYSDTAAAAPVDVPAAEFIAWVRGLRAEGERISGEELSRSAREVGASSAAREHELLVGFFILEAADLDAAARIAGSSPHARHGGRVVVRPIVPT